MSETAMADGLLLALGARAGSQVADLRRLSGGANMETWSFDVVDDGHVRPLILRRLPATASEGDLVSQFSLETEAQLVSIAQRNQVQVPAVIRVLEPSDELGRGYIMSRKQGEALPFRILADQCFSKAREKLAFQCGEALGRIHAIALDQLPAELPDLSVAGQLARNQELLDQYGNVSPVHQLALNWLRANRPAERKPCLVHGDFRNGNLLVDENGLVAVLDWELAHVGSPVEDLGYICGNVWRFGNVDKPVGGFGDYAQLLDGYRSVTGWAPTLEEVRYWEVYTALGWGLVCLTMLAMYRGGSDTSLERAAVGRRLSESEIDLMLLLDGQL